MVPEDVTRPGPPRGLREIVLGALGRVEPRGTFLHEVLARAFEKHAFPPRLRGLAVDLASGILRRRLTLDHLIAEFSDRRVSRIDRRLLDILRLAVYEILFVDDVPARASVHQAVELTKTRVRDAFAAFTNAVLRQLTRAVASMGPAEPGLSRRTLPVEGNVVVRFNRDVLPDPEAEFTDHLSVIGGVPAWLVARWQRRLEPDAVLQVVRAAASKPPLTIRVNRLRTSRETLVDELSRLNVATSADESGESLRIDTPVTLTALDAFREGRFYIADASALRAPMLLRPRPGERVLDLCAAPGGKTTHLAEIAGDRAEILAVDVSTKRLERVAENARRLGITSITTRGCDARCLDDDLAGTFDAVLVDVPCSNTGVLRRRVEARHRLTPETIDALRGRQAEILRAAIEASRPTGRVVYSTCSIEPEENREVVRSVLAKVPDWTLDVEEDRLPRADGADGGYAARLVHG